MLGLLQLSMAVMEYKVVMRKLSEKLMSFDGFFGILFFNLETNMVH